MSDLRCTACKGVVVIECYVWGRLYCQTCARALFPLIDARQR